MKAFYMDESGEWNPVVRDADYPVFVLGGIIADKDYADGPLTDAVNDFKRELFGDSGIILHTADIARNHRQQRPDHIAVKVKGAALCYAENSPALPA